LKKNSEKWIIQINSMTRTLVYDAVNKVEEQVTLMGYVDKLRDHGKITFIDLRDRTGIIQCVGENLPKVSLQSAIEIVGKVNKRPESMVNKSIDTGHIEVWIEKIQVLSPAAELPFDMGSEQLNLQLPTLLDYRTLTLRHEKVAKIFKVQESLMEGFRIASQKIGCVEIFTPTISASSTEGGSNVFKFKYYGHDAFLVQSPQLYKQMLIPSFERVYLVSRAYRAEPSVTTRHLSESIQMDCEIGFADFNELLYAMEFVVRETILYAASKCAEILKEYKTDELKITEAIPRLTLREAQKIIKDRTGLDHTAEPDLMPGDEKEIWNWARSEKNSDLVTITHFPTIKRAFYTMPDPKDPKFSLSYDLIFRGVELLSGSQRINDYSALLGAIKARGMNPSDFEMYLQAFKYGMPPEGGFSFGLERATWLLLGLGNIREASLFPRDMERVDFRFPAKKKKSPPKGH